MTTDLHIYLIVSFSHTSTHSKKTKTKVKTKNKHKAGQVRGGRTCGRHALMPPGRGSLVAGSLGARPVSRGERPALSASGQALAPSGRTRTVGPAGRLAATRADQDAAPRPDAAAQSPRVVEAPTRPGAGEGRLGARAR